LIFTSDLYDHGLRLRSFELAANVMRTLGEKISWSNGETPKAE